MEEKLYIRYWRLIYKKMLIRNIKPSDSEQVYENFISESIVKQDLSKKKPIRGFYEYPLSYDDISRRTDSPFSILIEQSGGLIGYILAYDINYIQSLSAYHQDSVHEKINIFDRDVVYLDQLFINPNYSITLAARLVDTWENLIQKHKVPGVITAIPSYPWKNKSSTRIALARGYSRKNMVYGDKVILQLFAKPYLPLEFQFEGSGDNLILAGN